MHRRQPLSPPVLLGDEGKRDFGGQKVDSVYT